jgi:catechol 2,3-dioxygenase-like lactoylglutathione lyase family enzyme
MDHIVLTTINSAACEDFYIRVLGMTLETFTTATGDRRTAFKYGHQKINIHHRGREFEPKAHLPLDLCFIANRPLDDVIIHINGMKWPVIEGPVRRTGANGPIRSIYLRDPDLNLIEISEYIKA